jgi:predicted dehydrogenase
MNSTASLFDSRPPASAPFPAADATEGPPGAKSRRLFLRDVGVAAAALSAAPAVVAAQNAVPGPRPLPKTVRIGVVGGGFGAAFQWHLHPNCKVVAVCDKREERIQKLKRVYQCDFGYPDYAEFLKHPGLDAVALFTPAPFHVKMAVEAFNLGKHVISAVPAGLSVAELEQLLDAVKKTGLKYMMAETSRYRPEVMTCLDWAKAGKFGEIFYSEAEYHHTGLGPYAFGTTFDCQTCEFIHSIDQVNRDLKAAGRKLVPTWAYAYPPMLYPTHCTGIIIPVTGERLTEVTAHGWGNDDEMLKKNYYDNNPFIHTVALFKMSKPGHCCRISIGWNIAAQGTERGLFYGDKMSFIMTRPEGSPNTVVEQKFKPDNPFGPFGGEAEAHPYDQQVQFERLPEPLRVKSGHGNSHAFITHEFVSAILEDRHPEVNVWEAIAYTLPGIIAHQSALAGGACLKIRDYGRAPA